MKPDLHRFEAETDAEQETHIRLLRSCRLDALEIEEVVVCLHDRFIELFGPVDQA